jgi:GDP-D-mannose 3',5'-epimerase
MKNNKILVTGGAGFIGSTLVKRLAAEGVDVSVIDNLWRGSLENLRTANGAYAIDIASKFYLADLTDYSKCLELIRGFDLIYHLADVVGGIQFAFGNEAFVFRQNILINTNVLAACTLNRIPNYVYVGTACSYPKSLQMQDLVVAFKEDQVYPAEPESSYGWSKLMGEYEAELAQKTGKLSVGLLRFHNVYGPGASFETSRSQVLPSLILKAIHYPHQPFIVWGNGKQYRDFIYIDDIVEALMRIPERGMNCGPIQIGSEKATTIREAAELVVRISGKPIEIIYDTTKPEGDHGRIAICDKARTILGWSAKVDLETGLKNSYEWILQQVSALEDRTEVH